jgi:segregation and condensation protein B
MFNVKNFLLSLLHTHCQGLSVHAIQDTLVRYHQGIDGSGPQLPGVPLFLSNSQIHEALCQTNRELEQEGSPFRILETPDGLKLAVIPEYSPFVRALRHEAKPMKWSAPLLETLSIIAYQQPVTKARIEAIRGVCVDTTLPKLIELELVEVQGRADLPGRPLQYKTSLKFLQLCGLKALDQLPVCDGLRLGESFGSETHESTTPEPSIQL